MPLLATFIQTTAMAQIKYPVTEKVAQTDDYFGVKVADPYRWLENDTAANTRQWVATQQHFTNAYFEKLPLRKQVLNDLRKVMQYPRLKEPTTNNGYLFYKLNTGLQNQDLLYYCQSAEGEEKLLIDPNSLSADATVALINYSPSKSNKYLAYSVSASGSDWQKIYIMDMATKKLLKETIDHVKFSGIKWVGNDGFYYSGYTKPKDAATKYSAKTEFQKLYYHKIGTAQSADKIVYEDKKNAQRYVFADLTDDERFLVLNISEGTDGSEIRVKDLKKGGDFFTVVPGFATNASVIGNDGDKLLIQTNNGASNNRIISTPASNNDTAKWKTIVPETHAISNAAIAGGKLLVTYLVNVNSVVMQYDITGKPEREIRLPATGIVSEIKGEKAEKNVYFSLEDYVTPANFYRYNVATRELAPFYKTEIRYDAGNYSSEQVIFTSKDGTKVPMMLNYKKGMQKDSSNPVLLYGYGGFSVNILPAYNPAYKVLMDRGAIVAVVTLRGGNEFGEDWHKAGMLQNKQNVFDDFIAAGEYLIKEKYTSSKHLAIQGGSNGGLLVGAVMTQRPDLMRVAVPEVGVLDMLRYHNFTVGWGWIPEYGSSDKKEDFENLVKYSPLHNIRTGQCYPATLITTADHDDRVVPAHSFKFGSALQAAQQCDNPVLLRIDSKAGHGAGKPLNKRLDHLADVYSFILHFTR